MKIILWIAAIVVVTFGWLTYVTTRPSGATSTTTAATAASSRPTTRTLARASRVSSPAPEVAGTAPHDEPEITVAGQRKSLEDRFATETRDATWATTAQQELHADLGRFATRDVGVRDVQCRASLCRIELSLSTRDSASTFMESWLRQRTWTGPGMADNEVIAADGKLQMVMFLGKDGMDL